MSAATSTWIDGSPANSLPLPDRGLDFGDGLFETCLVCNGRVSLFSLHEDRLRLGLQALRFPPVTEQVRAQVESALESLDSQVQYALRVTVTRGTSPRGYAPPVEQHPRIVITATELTGSCFEMREPAQLGICDIRWSDQPALAGVKHLNRLEQVLAAAQVRDAGWGEGLMLDQQGDPISVSTGNLFIVEGDCVITPPLATCGIEGTRRRWVLQTCEDHPDLQARIEAFTLERLQRADEVFVSNALVGVRPISGLDGRHWDDHPVCHRLFDAYSQVLAE